LGFNAFYNQKILPNISAIVAVRALQEVLDQRISHPNVPKENFVVAWYLFFQIAAVA